MQDRSVDVVSMTGTIPGNTQQEAVLDYHVTLYQGKSEWSAPVSAFQLQPQYNIESNHPAIVECAAQVLDGQSRRDAAKAFTFTSEYLARPVQDRPFVDASALLAFETRLGTCGDCSNLMVALCRAAGIPAQTVIGILFPDIPPYSTASTRSLNHPGESHAWVEFHAENGWEMADPSCKSGSYKWLLFGRNDGRHLSYGEAGKLTETYAKVRNRAARYGTIVLARFSSVKFVAAAEPNNIMVTPRITMKKGWDGRWFNMIASWLVTFVIVSKINRYQVSRIYPPCDSDSESNY